MGRLADALRTSLASPVVREVAATLTLSVAGMAVISVEEGTVPVVYRDVASINTVCTGHVTNLKVGTRVPDETCELLLQQDSASAQRAVQSAVKVPLSQAQFDALVDFAFNEGNSALAGSQIVRLYNAGDCHGAAAAFMNWTRAGGNPKALVGRRTRERAKFEADCP